MNRVAFYCAYHNGSMARKMMDSIPLDKCASENRIMTEAEFSTMLEKSAEGFGDTLMSGYNKLKDKYLAMSPEHRRLLHTGLGLAGGGLLGGLATNKMGYGFMPGALIGGGLGTFGGWKFGDKAVSGLHDLKHWGQGKWDAAKLKAQKKQQQNTGTGDSTTGIKTQVTPDQVTPADVPDKAQRASTNAERAANPYHETTHDDVSEEDLINNKGGSERPITWDTMLKMSAAVANPAVSKAKVMAQQAQIDAQVAQQNADAQMQKAQIQETHDAEMEKIKAEKERQRQVEMKQKQLMEGIKQRMQIEQQPQVPGQPAQPAMQPGTPARPGAPVAPGAAPGAAPALPVR